MLSEKKCVIGALTAGRSESQTFRYAQTTDLFYSLGVAQIAFSEFIRDSPTRTVEGSEDREFEGAAQPSILISLGLFAGHLGRSL